jgi:hypothetical protein
MKRFFLIITSLIMMYNISFSQQDAIWIENDTILINKVQVNQSYIISGWYINNAEEKKIEIAKLLKPIVTFLKMNDSIYVSIEGFSNCRDQDDVQLDYEAMDGLITSQINTIAKMLQKQGVMNLIVTNGKDCKERLPRVYNAPEIAILTLKTMPNYDLKTREDFPCRYLRFWNSESPCSFCDTTDLTTNSAAQLAKCDYYLTRYPNLKLCLYINPLLTKGSYSQQERIKTVKKRISKEVKYPKRFEVKVYEGAIPEKHKKYEAWIEITDF